MAHSQRKIGLQYLPTEVLCAICSTLCLHCRLENMVSASSGVVAAAQQDQKALAMLSRSSKVFLDVAQPILFHFYHTGSADRTRPRGQALRSMKAFLFTIFERPHLTRAVRALAFTIETDRWAEPVDPETQTFFRRAAERVEFRHQPGYSNVGLYWMQEVAIAMTPSLEQLLVYRGAFLRPFKYLASSPVMLPNLKFLFCPGVSRNQDRYYHVSRMQMLIAKAQNLDYFIAHDYDGWGISLDLSDDIYDDIGDPWHTSLPKLRKLSLSGQEPDILSEILMCCPVLEEFYYFQVVAEDEILRQEQLDLVSSTVQRLSYEIGESSRRTQIDEVWMALRHSLEDTIGLEAPDFDLSFAHFPKLQYLKIQQVFLYCPYIDWEVQEFEIDDCQKFLGKLPSTLRVLDIDTVISWSDMYRDLMALSEAAERFPNLIFVRLEAVDHVPKDQIELLSNAFWARNVMFFVVVRR